MPTSYLRTDHWTDPVSSLEAAQEFAGRVTVDQRQWKWLLISVHCAVQGFMALRSLLPAILVYPVRWACFGMPEVP